MYRNHSIALIIPAHNEQKLIRHTLSNVPQAIDQVIVVDDASTDKQNDVIADCQKTDHRIQLIRHEMNQGPGGAIITGYERASKLNFDIVVVVGGDWQMDLSEVDRFLDPIVEDRADYTKGNRFQPSQYQFTSKVMPKTRFFANWIITAITKMASGYYDVMDVVDGYTAISKKALKMVDWSGAWRGYGYPMDFLIRMNAHGLRVLDIPRKPIYRPGVRQSQINGVKYALKVSPMLLRAFFWRLRYKYIYMDFHPLVFFYFLGILLVPFGMFTGGYLVADKLFLGGHGVTAPKAILVALTLISGFQFFLFAMLFDRQESKDWRKSGPRRSEPTLTEKELAIEAVESPQC